MWDFSRFCLTSYPQLHPRGHGLFQGPLFGLPIAEAAWPQTPGLSSQWALPVTISCVVRGAKGEPSTVTPSRELRPHLQLTLSLSIIRYPPWPQFTEYYNKGLAWGRLDTHGSRLSQHPPSPQPPFVEKVQYCL